MSQFDTLISRQQYGSSSPGWQAAGIQEDLPGESEDDGRKSEAEGTETSAGKFIGEDMMEFIKPNAMGTFWCLLVGFEIMSSGTKF